MSSIIVKVDSKVAAWTLNRRYRIGRSVSHNSGYWTNITGGNSEPGVGVDWLFVSGLNAVHVSTKELFTATAAQTAFVLSNIPGSVDVFIDRVVQIETIDYNLAGNTVTMTSGVDVGGKVDIRKY